MSGVAPGNGVFGRIADFPLRAMRIGGHGGGHGFGFHFGHTLLHGALWATVLVIVVVLVVVGLIVRYLFMRTRRRRF